MTAAEGGDPLFGSSNSQIATQLARQSRYVMLLRVAAKQTEPAVLGCPALQEVQQRIGALFRVREGQAVPNTMKYTKLTAANKIP